MDVNSSMWKTRNVPHYLILASSTEGLRSGVSFLLRGGLPDVEVFDGDCACADITEGREAVVGGRISLDCCPRFVARISWEDSDN